MSRVLVIPDLHEPFCLPGFRRFCLSVQRRFKTNRTVFIGDIVDLHALSQWEHDPDGHSAGEEYRRAKRGVKRWMNAFSEADVILGNHDQRPYRKAFSAGIPADMLKSYQEIWGTPNGWNWRVTVEIDGVIYTHKPPAGGENAIVRSGQKKRQSVVFGHLHHGAGVFWHASERDLIFAMNVGAGMDKDTYAMAYATDFPNKPTIGCGVVLDGREAFWVPMDLGTKYPEAA